MGVSICSKRSISSRSSRIVKVEVSRLPLFFLIFIPEELQHYAARLGQPEFVARMAAEQGIRERRAEVTLHTLRRG